MEKIRGSHRTQTSEAIKSDCSPNFTLPGSTNSYSCLRLVNSLIISAKLFILLLAASVVRCYETAAASIIYTTVAQSKGDPASQDGYKRNT